MTPREVASQNLESLAANPYPGRLVGVGRMGGGNPLLVTAITDRSAGSRNRVYLPGIQKGSVTITKADYTKVGDTSNRFYDPMGKSPDGAFLIASNGVQTDLVNKGLELFAHGDLATVLTKHCFGYEDDLPISTPRITAVCFLRAEISRFAFQLAILKRSIFDESLVAQNFGYEDIAPGFSMFLATYADDDNPPPHFAGEPFTLPLFGDAEVAAATIWDALNKENRVALAVMEIDARTKEPKDAFIINKYTYVPMQPADLPEGCQAC